MPSVPRGLASGAPGPGPKGGSALGPGHTLSIDCPWQLRRFSICVEDLLDPKFTVPAQVSPETRCSHFYCLLSTTLTPALHACKSSDPLDWHPQSLPSEKQN